MSQMQHAVEFLKANLAWIIPLLSYIALDVANGLKSYPTASSRLLWLHGLLDRISVHQNADALGTFKLPGKRSTRPGSSSSASGRIPAAAVLLPFLLLSASCQCFKPETRNTPACAVLHQVIDCTSDAALNNLAPPLAALIRTYLSDPNQTPNWDGLIAALESAGIKDGGCIIAQLIADFISKPSADPMRAVRIKDALSALERYKAKHNLVGVKYKVMVAGKAVSL